MQSMCSFHGKLLRTRDGEIVDLVDPKLFSVASLEEWSAVFDMLTIVIGKFKFIDIDVSIFDGLTQRTVKPTLSPDGIVYVVTSKFEEFFVSNNIIEIAPF